MKSKKVKAKVVGVKELVDTSTGEVLTAEVIVKEVGDVNFKKIWISHILEAIEEIGSARVMVLFYLMDKADHNNRVIGTVRSIAQETGVGINTVARLLKALQNHNLIKREHPGVWQLNPEIVFKGSHNRRMDILIRYQGIEQSQS